VVPPVTDVAKPVPAAGRFWRDADGRVVVAQRPNLPFIGWLFFAALSRILGAGHGRSGAGFISSAFLFTWAYFELTHGVNYFRRLLGLIVLAAVIGSHLR
jgi:hypothetical protein